MACQYPHPWLGARDAFLDALYANTVTRLSCLSRSRWVRLLFGREFPLQDLLVVWDALFADSITLDLVDYIFVAMLLYIRDARTLRLFRKLIQ